MPGVDHSGNSIIIAPVTAASSGFEQSFDDTVAVTLRFPGNRLAQFNLSYYGAR